MSILVLAEHDNTELKAATLNAITAASQLEGDIHVLVAGNSCASVAEEAAKVAGVSKVLTASAAHYEHQIAEEITPLVLSLADNYSHILAAATTTGKNIMPCVAALIDSSQISEITAVRGNNAFTRLIYAGNAVADVSTTDSKIVLTVRMTAFDAAETGSNNAPIESVDTTAASGNVNFGGRELTVSERPELTAADIVVSGGRGVGSSENFAIIEALADKLNAAVGASRAAVDAGYVPNDYQVGQTGKVVAPNMYIAVGISGAIQHLAGMKDSKVIVAINKDEEAPIFQVADYGLVADLFEAVPEMTDKL